VNREARHAPAETSARAARINNAHAAVIPDQNLQTRQRDAASPGGSKPAETPGETRREVKPGELTPSDGRPRRDAAVPETAVRATLASPAVAGALRDRAGLRNPAARAAISANAAVAAFQVGRDPQDGRGDHTGNADSRAGWWRHRDGGYGWVGPLFWPFAYDDFTDYTLWGESDAASFWDYGYNDLYAGIFSPYGYDQLTGYLPESSGPAPANAGSGDASAAAQASAAPAPIQQMCGDDGHDIAAVAGMPTDQLQAALRLNDAQHGLLDDLANASVKAAQDIKAACPTRIAVTAPARLADMQERIEAMIAAVAEVQPPLQKFYDGLDDNQKAQLNAIGAKQRAAVNSPPNGATSNPVDGDAQVSSAPQTGGSLAGPCGVAAAGINDWPTAAIDGKLHPTEAQHKSLIGLHDASEKAGDLLQASCRHADAITPPARLAAVGQRLGVMLQAVTSVHSALDDFYDRLSDEQKAQFEAIGPQRTDLALAPPEPAAASHAEAPAPVHHHAHLRRYHASLFGVVRRLISLTR